MNHRSVIFDTTVRVVFDAAIVLSLYLLFAGHNQPGGGFVGGLVAAAALALRYLAGGIDEVRPLLPVRPWTLLSAGLALASGTALWSVFTGHAPLDHEAYGFHPALLGDVKVTTAAVFDGGVYLIVVGLLLMVLEALGEGVGEGVGTGDEEERS